MSFSRNETQSMPVSNTPTRSENLIPERNRHHHCKGDHYWARADVPDYYRAAAAAVIHRRIVWINVIVLVLINWCTLYDNGFTSPTTPLRITRGSFWRQLVSCSGNYTDARCTKFRRCFSNLNDVQMTNIHNVLSHLLLRTVVPNNKDSCQFLLCYYFQIHTKLCMRNIVSDSTKSTCTISKQYYHVCYVTSLDILCLV